MSDNNQNTPQGGRKYSLLVPLLLTVSVAACCAAGYFYWKYKNIVQVKERVAELKKPPVVEDNPLYFSLNKFTVSLKQTSAESDRVLFIGISVRVADKKSLLLLEKFLPEYRSRLFLLLTQQTYEALSTDEGKAQLISRLKDEIATPIGINQTVKPIDVLINEFILR